MAGLSFEDLDALESYRDQLLSIDDIAPEQTKPIRQGIIDRVRSSPVLQQYLRHLEGSASPRNRYGWHAEGERQYAALLLAACGTRDGPRLTTADDQDLPPDLGIGLAMRCLLAQVYLWSDEIEDVAKATPLPPHVVSRDALPFPLMFWSREIAYITAGGRETNWMLVMHIPQGIRIVVDMVRPHDDYALVIGDIPYGATFPRDFHDDDREGAASVLSRLAFLASPYIAPREERVPRAWRRDAVRKGLPVEMADPLVRVVKLRREAQESIEREREDRAQASRERRSHWWVSGHHRAQWYPSEQAHKVIWIAPYLKGDLAKPLASKVYSVVR